MMIQTGIRERWRKCGRHTPDSRSDHIRSGRMDLRPVKTPRDGDVCFRMIIWPIY